MNSLDIGYQMLLQEIIGSGVEKDDRTGTGTFSVFGGILAHDMSDGFPLLTTKKMAVKTMVTELKWFLKGGTNIKYLVENGCNIWNGDAYKAYCKNWGGQNRYSVKTPIIEKGVVVGSSNRKFTQKEFIEKIKTDDEFAEKWGELGPIYGKQWRNLGGKKTDGFIEYESNNYSEDIKGIDQIANLINNLKTNPDSRRHIVNAWNVGELDQMTLPPCHYGFQCYVDNGKLSLMWSQRSVDTFLGLPFNIASYGLLLLLLCDETGLEPGTLKGSLGDVHLYKNHLKPAIEQISRTSYDLPTMKVSNVDILNGEFDWELIDYKCHPRIKAPLSN
jgi:thymidylate synthase